MENEAKKCPLVCIGGAVLEVVNNCLQQPSQGTYLRERCYKSSKGRLDGQTSNVTPESL